MENKIKAIKIDVVNREVYEIEIENNLKGYYNALECSIIERVQINRKHDLIIDEEGWLSEPVGVFRLGRQFYAGHGLIVGHDGNGNWISHSLDVWTVEMLIMFMTKQKTEG